MNFVLNIFASLIAGATLLLIVSLVSKWARWMLTGLLGRILDVDIEYVFPNKTDAMADLQREVKRASEICILASRGNEFQREPFTSIFHERPQDRKVRVRILLPKTTLPKREYDWTAQRDRELAEFDQSFGTGLLRTQIETNVDFLTPYVTSKALECRRFNSPHIGRIILTDRCVYYVSVHSLPPSISCESSRIGLAPSGEICFSLRHGQEAGNRRGAVGSYPRRCSGGLTGRVRRHGQADCRFEEDRRKTAGNDRRTQQELEQLLLSALYGQAQY